MSKREIVLVLHYRLIVSVDPDGEVHSWWARLRLALSILAGRPIRLCCEQSLTNNTDEPVNINVTTWGRAL